MPRTLLTALLVATPAFADAPTTSPSPAPALVFAEGFATPESVLYDAQSDTYLVSNIDGSPLNKDNNGFISELSPDGKVLNARWIEGGKNGVTLNAPKGSAILDGRLYVADIDVVRIFDRKTGAPRGEIAIDGVSFLNDVAVGAAGRIYVSDSGLSPSFEPTGTDAVYVVVPPTTIPPTASLSSLVKSKDLRGPNGLLVTNDAVHVVSFGANELQTYDLSGQRKGAPIALPGGGLDGIVAAGADLLVSSWGAKAIYRGKPGGTWTALVTDLEAPADIGYDSKRHRVLVPRFQSNRVEVWDVK